MTCSNLRSAKSSPAQVFVLDCREMCAWGHPTVPERSVFLGIPQYLKEVPFLAAAIRANGARMRKTQLCAKMSEENSPMKEGLSSIVANRIYGSTTSYDLNKCINLIDFARHDMLYTLTIKHSIKMLTSVARSVGSCNKEKADSDAALSSCL